MTQESLKALKSAIKLIADAVSDTIRAASDTNAVAKLSEYTNLMPDLAALVPQIGNISLSGLSPADYAALLTELATDLSLPPGHTALLINASLKLLEDIALVIVPDIQAVIAAIQSPVAANAVAAPIAV